MKYWFPVVLVVTLTLVPLSANAQTPSQNASQQTSSPTVNLGYVGANTGVTFAAHASGVVGGEAGVRVWKNLDVVAELTYMHNVVTNDTLSQASTIATSLQAMTGQPATSDVVTSAVYVGAGVRWVFEQTPLSRFRPYVILTIGNGHTNRKPTFTLNGVDVTNSLANYGVTLGSDLIGTENSFTVDTGGGVLTTFNQWYADVGFRYLGISTSPQHTNVGRLFVGGGYRF